MKTTHNVDGSITLSREVKEIDECNHQWILLDGGMNYWGYYWMEYECSLCGKTKTDWVD